LLVKGAADVAIGICGVNEKMRLAALDEARALVPFIYIIGVACVLQQQSALVE
jgi:hypothetical protein